MGSANLNAVVALNANQQPITMTPVAPRAQPVNVMQRLDFESPSPAPTTDKRYFGLFFDKYSEIIGSDSIEIDEWLPVFELLAENMADSDKIKAVARHLTGDALKWFAVDRMSVEKN